MSSEIIAIFTGLATFALSVLTSLHIVLNKEKGRATVGWLGFVWLFPFIGPLLYLFFGINRIERKLKRLGIRPREVLTRTDGDTPDAVNEDVQGLARAIGRVSGATVRTGNDVEFLYTGDVCYPRMLEAIDEAEHSIALLTFMFDNDPVGQEFAASLGRAVERGVEVRVLIDGIGSLYTLPPIVWQLSRNRVPFARFLWSLWPWKMAYVNMRNHRKLLIVDGNLAFTGGMNIRHNNRLLDRPRHPVQDLHARVRGPIVADLMQVFSDDWTYTTGEELNDAIWWPSLHAVGDATLRCLPAGPDATVESVRWTYLAALQQAQERVRIVTPYFLPEDDLLAAMSSAALRGVRVELVLPATPNVSYLWWATLTALPALRERDVHIFQTRPPFSHTKLLVVDEAWALFGSSNWDARSLRLNFELNVECYTPEVVTRANALVDSFLEGSRELTEDDLDQPRWQQLRGRLARLFQPYL